MWFSARVEPPSPGPWAQSVQAGYGAGFVNNSYFVGHRFLYDDAHHVFLGYDLSIESQPHADTFRASTIRSGNLRRRHSVAIFNTEVWISGSLRSRLH